MTMHGRIRNGMIVLEKSTSLPEGAEVEVEVKAVQQADRQEKQRNISRLADGISYDFDALDRLREASKL